MHFPGKALALAAALIETIHALPSYSANSVEKRYDGFSDDLSVRLGSYIAPGPNDSRGPCPALNTLANHGLINRNGKNLNSSDIKTAFPRGFGIDESGFDMALHNFEVVCEYVMGLSCGTGDGSGTFILTNLTLLGEPHAFEHDHSFSRADYRQNWAHGAITDNIYFNSSEFQNSLNVVEYSPTNPPIKKLATMQDFNEIRLQRTSQQNQADFPGSFQQNIPVQLTEVGFIFGAVSDRDSKGNIFNVSNPRVRLDWWNFWFSEESFPTKLGWTPASTEVFNINFITSVSSAVLAQSITSTPSSLPAGATAASQPPASNLPEQDPSPTYLLFQGTPYVAPTAPASIQTEASTAFVTKRDDATTTFASSVLSAVANEVTAAPNVIASAMSLVGAAPSKYNFYAQSLDVNSVKAQIAMAQSYESAVIASVTALGAI